MTDHCYLNSYIGVIAPTSEEYNEQDENCNDFRQVLQPITGTGGHWALMYGTHLGFHICDYEQWSFRTALDINGRYLFEEDEFRTFDLKGKPWSRYMQFYTPEQAAEAFADANKVGIGTSGVNLLTRCAEVTPGYDGRVNTAFIFERCNFAVELGFNVNYQQAEEIECPSLAKEPFAIKAAGGLGEIDPLRTIGKNCDDTIQAASEEEARQNVRDNAITRNDLDLSSASHPATLHHTVYGNLGYNFEHNCIPGFISVGGSYTFGATNNELENWALWGKLGISF